MGNGYNTAWFGKHHLIPDWLQSPDGPFDQWASGLGFDESFDVGEDTGTPVIDEYDAKMPFRFSKLRRAQRASIEQIESSWQWRPNKVGFATAPSRVATAPRQLAATQPCAA